MTRSDIDNDLARLLGPDAIPDDERSSIVARLLADDEAMSQAADAAAVLRELEAEEGIVVVDETAHDEPPRVGDADPAHDPKVVTLPPPSTRRTWRRPPARWLALAAVFVGALLVLPPRFGGRGAADAGEFVTLVADPRLPDEWRDSVVWPVPRGGPGEVAISEDVTAANALAARAGALHMDLELAVAARQEAQTAEFARAIATMLNYVTAGGTVLPIYRGIEQRAGKPEALAESLTEGREGLAMLVGEDYFNLGAWAEAARRAARQRDEEFFRARASRRMLDRAASVPSPEDATRASVEKIRAALAPDEPDWMALRSETDQLLRSLAH